MKKLNLVTKTFILFSALLFFAILLSGIFSSLTFYNMIKTVATYSIEQNTVLISNILSKKTTSKVISLLQDAENIQSLENKSNLRLTLISDEGVVLYDSQKDSAKMDNHINRPEISEALNEETGNSIRYSKTIKEYMVYSAKTFNTENGNKIILRISASIPTLASQFNSFITVLVIIFLFIIFVTIIVSFYINSLMLKSIKTLIDAGRKWSKGELDYRIPSLKDKYFGELSETMNIMASDIQMMLARLKKLENMRKDFVANVSHELRTPITLIKGFTETMLNDAPDDIQQQNEFLKIMNKNADRMALIIKDLLTLSTLENSENTKQDFIPVEASFLVNTCVSIFETKAKEKNIIVNKHSDSNIYAFGNPGLLETALSNLIENAIKYSPENTEVFVVAVKKEHYIHFTVKNTGVVIPKEHIGRIFERFYRVDKARSKAVGGTGLGLAIVKHISIGHQGGCTVDSNEKHTLFTLKIPAVDVDG